MKSSTFRHPQKVLNAVPGDFTQDGKLDILVMAQDNSNGAPRGGQLGIQLYVGLPQGGFGACFLRRFHLIVGQACV